MKVLRVLPFFEVDEGIGDKLYRRRAFVASASQWQAQTASPPSETTDSALARRRHDFDRIVMNADDVWATACKTSAPCSSIMRVLQQGEAVERISVVREDVASIAYVSEARTSALAWGVSRLLPIGMRGSGVRAGGSAGAIRSRAAAHTSYETATS